MHTVDPTSKRFGLYNSKPLGLNTALIITFPEEQQDPICTQSRMSQTDLG